MKTGNTPDLHQAGTDRMRASMEPGHEDREYIVTPPSFVALLRPQWSPVMKTGNTGTKVVSLSRTVAASMEPGHEDREYTPAP